MGIAGASDAAEVRRYPVTADDALRTPLKPA
jgi:hypothetical protein